MSAPVLVIFLVYTDAHQATGLMRLRQLVERLFVPADIHYLVVDNACEEPLEERLPDGTWRISGDNRCREFSGYDHGMRWFESRMKMDERAVIVVANDTFDRSYGCGYLEGFTRWRVAQLMHSQGLLGYLDAFPQQVTALGYVFQTWVRSSLILLTYSTLKRIGSFCLDIDRERLFRNDADERFFSEAAPLSENYRSFIRTWLFAPPDNATFDKAWHSKTLLTQDNVTAMRDKAVCILCEHLLSARVRQQGLPLIAVNEAELPRLLRRPRWQRHLSRLRYILSG